MRKSTSSFVKHQGTKNVFPPATTLVIMQSQVEKGLTLFCSKDNLSLLVCMMLSLEGFVENIVNDLLST